MCGICGVLDFKGRPSEPELIRRMVATLHHRGPDDTGFYHGAQVSLGHARLSIIDLAGGHQPMADTEGSLWITFNGEVFNYIELRDELIRKGHKFATQSDTEVILELYREEGEDCVQHLNGQWAFAIWDAAEKKLFVSRDRLGVRPLFYTLHDGKFLFASEIKALLAYPGVERDLDLEALEQIFTFWVTLPPRTAFRDIWQLPPGHSLALKDGQVRISRYWSLEYSPHETAGRDEEELAEELLGLLSDAARIRLRSDVPVGTYLSGGLDSTMTTALTRSFAGARLRSFGVSFEDVEFDERAYQKQASDFLATEHTDVHCRTAEIADVFPEVIRHTEQPILRTAPAPLYMLSKVVRESGFKVVLTGEGADEILGGYDIYKEAKIRRFCGRWPESRWRPLLLRRLYPYMEKIQAQPDVYLRRFFRVGAEDLDDPFFSHLPRWELTEKLKTFFSDRVANELLCSDAYSQLRDQLPDNYPGWQPFCQAQYLESTCLLPGYILSSQGDRMAMAHSVEGRYPFLDHRVVEFAGRLSPSLKMRVLNEKYLLKRIAKGRVPESIIARKKQPYRAPDGACFVNGKAKAYVDELLSAETIRNFDIFNAASVSRLVEKFRVGRALGTRDNMALVGILSTQLLVHGLVQGHMEDLHAGASTEATCVHS